ncbi:peroxidase family protein [Rhodovulum euryhalinum]|uniref:Heme peroxidase n=1 Tax=Rhodovulum euryhalinum TaxID=35805 RepID=A0A4R2KFK1_9RHOB|nr:heme peroxidase family protein [Rhodovulum euryhalinum]TCO72461.1 heme peroxidase [Rhodovulum euryhalinum]
MTYAVNLNPHHGGAGRHPTRAYLDTLSGHDDPGKFGRMFPGLPGLHVDDDRLQALAQAMLDPGGLSGDNPRIPAGFTYFGQFIDHDITLDLTSLGEKMRDPTAVQNFRSPSLDLDSIYGRGPDGSPHMYARDPATGKTTPKLLLGRNITVGFGNVTGEFRNDLPRSPEGQALIGDHRNDENLIVAQTHLSFLKFHNKVVDHLADQGIADEHLFHEARQTVTWHYQWLVLHDFLGRLTQPGTVDRILHDGRKFYRFKKFPYMPVEFSGAAYRLGHSMVRQDYDYNRVFPNADFSLLFGFTGLSGQIIGDLAPQSPTAPLPVSHLPSNWIIDWRRFYDLDDTMTPQATRKLDPFLAAELHTLPGGGGNLAFRNLKRGVQMGLPSGQSVADAMNIANRITADELASGPDGAVAARHGLHTQTPLWYYILKEAEVKGGGARLGPVGSAIVAEVLVGLVHGDHQSYLWQRGPGWRPSLPSATPGDFTMADMLRLVGDINPIGDG